MSKSKDDPPGASEISAAFAQRLVRLRTAKEWSPTRAAEELKISHWRLRKYEAAKREPPLWLLIRLADVYGVPISFLVAGNAEVVKFSKHSR